MRTRSTRPGWWATHACSSTTPRRRHISAQACSGSGSAPHGQTKKPRQRAPRCRFGPRFWLPYGTTRLASGALLRLGIPLRHSAQHGAGKTAERRITMHRIRALHLSATALTIAALLAAAPGGLPAQQAAGVAIDNDDIGGVVRSPRGPEAGVWVIAETTELPTKYAKMVVTDDQGRYVIPDLPNANYQVWVRGYGLVDSPKVRAKPGQQLNLTAIPAPNEAAAAHYYPTDRDGTSTCATW